MCIEAKSNISCFVELKDNCNKVANEIVFYPSIKIHFIIHICGDGVIKIVEH
jgi:hypothetical protein